MVVCFPLIVISISPKKAQLAQILVGVLFEARKETIVEMRARKDARGAIKAFYTHWDQLLTVDLEVDKSCNSQHEVKYSAGEDQLWALLEDLEFEFSSAPHFFVCLFYFCLSLI